MEGARRERFPPVLQREPPPCRGGCGTKHHPGCCFLGGGGGGGVGGGKRRFTRGVHSFFSAGFGALPRRAVDDEEADSRSLGSDVSRKGKRAARLWLRGKSNRVRRLRPPHNTKQPTTSPYHTHTPSPPPPPHQRSGGSCTTGGHASPSGAARKKLVYRRPGAGARPPSLDPTPKTTQTQILKGGKLQV